jgi:hypothetical protein
VGRMTLRVLAGVVAALACAGGAHADPVVYTWTGYGGFGPTSTGSKCGSYKMTVNVTVDGDAVKGVFQQVMRDERQFEAKLAKDGTFKTTAVVGNGGIMDVTGVINDGESTVVLDGYCKFNAKLSRK